MLFNSYSFIFLFLPIVYGGMFFLGRYSHYLAALWLGLASLAFYAVWDVRFVLLLLTSIVFNYSAGYFIASQRDRENKQAKHTLIAAISTNLILLGYFKYTNFFIGAANQFLASNIPSLDIILPLGISFFTFTQIAFLVDVYRGIAREVNFIHYLLFVTYFPHLIAGPVLHHKEMMPQFGKKEVYNFTSMNFLPGITLFAFGLLKKTGIADGLAPYANDVFAAAQEGTVLTMLEAWSGALAYTFQLYFDFSGYSDMAIGLALMTGVRLPLNFNSPYKAVNIIDFWRRWHMTLSRFLRDYLYFPLGGNKKGVARRYLNLMITMLLGGLWHGAGWTFIIWGGLHGTYLTVNHVWQALYKNRAGPLNFWERSISRLFTFLAVVVAWGFFRADSLHTAGSLLAAMSGVNGLSLPHFLANSFSTIAPNLSNFGICFEGITHGGGASMLLIEMFLLGVVWVAPNTQEIMAGYHPHNQPQSPHDQPWRIRLLRWEPSAKWSLITGIFIGYSILTMSTVSEFIYFNF